MGVVGLLCNSVDGKVAFIDDKVDELPMLLFDSQFCVSIRTVFLNGIDLIQKSDSQLLLVF